MYSFQHKKSSTPNSWAFPINFLSCAEIGSNCFADWEIGKIPQNSLSVPCWNENCKFGQNSMISQPNSQTTLFLLLFCRYLELSQGYRVCWCPCGTGLGNFIFKLTASSGGLLGLFGNGNLAPQQILHVINLVRHHIQLACQALNLEFGPSIHFKVQFAAHPVLHVLPVLTHHDDRRLDRRQHGEEEIKKNEGIGIPGFAPKNNVEHRIDNEQHTAGDDELPRSTEPGNVIGDYFAKRSLFLDQLVGIARGTQADEFLRAMKLAA